MPEPASSRPLGRKPVDVSLRGRRLHAQHLAAAVGECYDPATVLTVLKL